MNFFKVFLFNRVLYYFKRRNSPLIYLVDRYEDSPLLQSKPSKKGSKSFNTLVIAYCLIDDVSKLESIKNSSSTLINNKFFS